MPIVHTCASEDCEILTMGELCLDCERTLAQGGAEDLLATLRVVPVAATPQLPPAHDAA